MKLTITVIVAFCLVTTSLFAQNNYTVKGAVIDTFSNVKLVNTTVCVLNAKDSTLRKFTYAGDGGSFSIGNLPAGKFILLVSYPDYADYVEPFTLDAANITHDFGSISLQLKSKILQEVMIKGGVTAIKIKGDTTEFNAKAYVIQPNDKVEDLLKQLPGMQIDKDGKITANGQAVNKVLVDGEEFFGDDPTLVTKNIRADMVDKVQLYDKKSDQAAFTGIDDGVKTKTINIKLKEDKKNGTFGKINAGVATQDYYEGQAIFNRFKAKSKYSAYLTIANDGKTGLGFSDNSNIGASGGLQVGDDGSLYITNISNDALDSFRGNYDGNGQPLAKSGGVHYDSKWNTDKESINTNYKIGSIDVNGTTATTTQQNLSKSIINTNSNQTFDNYAFRQKLDATYQVKLDTANTLKVAADATLRNFRVNNNFNTVTTGGHDSLINKQNRAITNNGDEQAFNASALYTKKFKKPRRTFSWSLSEAYDKNETKGYLNSGTDFYDHVTGLKDSSQIVNQYKTSNTLSSVLSSNMAYTEPLSKQFSLVFNYGLGINNSTQDRKSFNQSAPGVYNVLDNAFSNNYRFNQLTNQAGAIISYNNKNKMIFNFGTKASNVDFKQVDEYTGIALKRHFINWAPQALLQYNPSQQQVLSLNYRGVTTQPTIDQIQPVSVNTDPQNITIGNADLKASFTHNINFFYSSSKQITGSSIFVSGNLSFTSDAIVNRSVTDTITDKTTTQYVNLLNKIPLNYSLFISTSYTIKPWDINWGYSLSGSGNTGYSYINGDLSTSKTYSYSGSVRLGKYVAKKYSLSIRSGPQYTINSNSLQPQANNNAGGYFVNGYVAYYLPGNFNIASDINYSYNAATRSFDAEYKTIWNASIGKTFLKDDKLKLALSANDLLNQNVNFSRNSTGNVITQTNTSGIKRYFMLTLSWDFTKFGTTAN